MSIDTSGLKDWPDAASLFSEASSLMTHGSDFYDDVEAAHSTWKGLSACYETPHQDLMYSALTSGQHASDGCASVTTAMTLFSDEISALKPERDSLMNEAAADAVTPTPYDETKAEEHRQAGIQLQQRINALVQKYEAAIDTCSAQLSAIGDDGLPDAGSPAWSGVAADTILGALTATAESRKKEVERIIHRLVVRLAGRDFRIPLPYWVQYREKRFWDWKSWLVTKQSGNFVTRFQSAIAAVFWGPARGRYSPPTVVRAPRISGKVGVGRQHTSRVRTGTSALGRAAGRGLFVLSLGLTFSSEYGQADKRYREQHPGMTADERRGKAIETATVRTGSQVGASIAAGAAIGSAIPVGGTAVGLLVGLGVGLAMSIDTGGGKTLGDRVADVGEAIWNFGKELFGG